MKLNPKVLITVLLFMMVPFRAGAQDKGNLLPMIEGHLDEIIALYNAQDFKTIYRDKTTARFKSSQTFAAFQDKMGNIFNEMGPVKSKRVNDFSSEEYSKFKMDFFRLQYRVVQEKGRSLWKIVWMKEKGGYLIDGFAVADADRILIAQGNLYGFLGDEDPAWSSQEFEQEWIDSKKGFIRQHHVEGHQRIYDWIVEMGHGNSNFDDREKKQLKEDLEKDVTGMLADRIGMAFRAGDIKTYYPNGNVKYFSRLNKENDERFVQAYYANGQLQKEIVYTVDGEIAKRSFKEYDPRGRLIFDEQDERPLYAAPIQNGVHKETYATGLSDETTYKDGWKDGPYKSYWKNGNLQIDANYKEGRQDGPYKLYYHSGQLYKEAAYKQGKSDGAFKEYYDDGRIYEEGSFKDDVMDNTWKRYDEDGKILQQSVYSDGRLLDAGGKPFECLRKEYYANSVSQDSPYKDGKLDGIVKSFDKDGKLYLQRTFKDGKVIASDRK